MVEHFHKGHLETPPPQKSKMNLSLIPGIGGHPQQKVHPEYHGCCNAVLGFYLFIYLFGFTDYQLVHWISKISVIRPVQYVTLHTTVLLLESPLPGEKVVIELSWILGVTTLLEEK